MPLEQPLELLKKAARGHPSALDTPCSLYWREVYRFVYGRVGNRPDAEDLTQETFFRALRAFPSFEVRDATFLPYLKRVAANLLVDHWQRRKRVPGSRPEAVDSLGGEDPELRDVLERGELLAALRSLPWEQREAIRLRLQEGRSAAEAAQMMQKTPEAVRALQYRGLQTLRRLLRDEEGRPKGDARDG